jgi:predicted nuclease with TOPRIM domain
MFTDNSLKELLECKESLQQNYAKKESELHNIETKLEALRNEKDAA